MDTAIGTLPITRSEMDFLEEFLMAFCHVSQAITLHTKVKKVSAVTKKGYYTPESLLLAVCEITGFTKEQIYSRSKNRGIADVRASISVIAHELWPECSLAKIGCITNKDHSTVLHHYEMARDIKEVNDTYVNLKLKLGLL